MKWFLALVFAAVAPLGAQQVRCSYTFDTTATIVPGTSSQQISGTFKVTTNDPSCTWTFGTTAPWIHIQPVIGSGNGSIPFSVDPNNSTLLRQDNIVFTAPGGVTGNLTIIQLAGTCTFAISPQSVSLPVGGGSGALQVTTGCPWASSSSQTWLAGSLDKGNLISTGNGGTTNYGNGIVNYSAAPNPCVYSRSAALTIITGIPGQPVFTVSEDGASTNLTLSQTSLNTGPGTASDRIIVTTGDGCAWNAFSDVSWLGFTSTSATSGTGSGNFVYNVLANPGPTRTGSIHVGPQTFTVTQAAVAAPTPQLNAVGNGASYVADAISPGEIVAIFGSNFGPEQAVRFQLSADGKSIPKTLAGVQVLFGGDSAVILYTSAIQINAIVPFSVAGKTTVPVQVSYQSQTSNTLTIPVQAATPGIYSQDFLGRGPGAILNQDNSLNTSLFPAAVGSVIQVFATGGGVTVPPMTDGVLSPSVEPLPRFPDGSVTVTIGGLPAHVNFAGNAPASVPGFTQINAVVPAGVTPGLSVPVVVQVGSIKSQTGLTIAVK